MCKAFQKAKSSVIDKDEGGRVPKFYIRCLVELEEFIAENWEDRKNINKNNSKALTSLRQKLRKYNKEFEQQIQEYKENPDTGDDDRDGEGQVSDDDEIPTKEFRAKSIEEDSQRTRTTSGASKEGGPGADAESDDDDDSVDWDMSSDESSSSSDDEDYGGNLAAKFLKKDTDKDKEVKKREKRVKEIRKKAVKEEAALAEEDGGGEWTTVEGAGTAASERPKMFAKDAEINHQVMLKKLFEILSMRGKKRVDRLHQIEMLNELLAISRLNNFGAALEVKILFGLQSALTDYSSGSCMKVEIWGKFLDNLETLLGIMISNDNLTVSELVQEDQESYQTAPFVVQGGIVPQIERMDEEFTRMLQVCDPHSPDYIDRLKDEIRVVQIIKMVRQYLEKDNRGTPAELCRAYAIFIDYLYYKFDKRVVDEREKRQAQTDKHGRQLDNVYSVIEEGAVPQVTDEAELNSQQVLDRLCKFIYIHDTTKRINKLATLCQVYHYSLHDCWFEARDLMLMSLLPSQILASKSDIPLQVLYNRALAQLGLCAFRHGHIYEAHSSLLDLLLKGRVRELLAQGMCKV